MNEIAPRDSSSLGISQQPRVFVALIARRMAEKRERGGREEILCICEYRRGIRMERK